MPFNVSPDEWNKLSKPEKESKVKDFFDECRALPDKQLKQFKELIISDIKAACDQLCIDYPYNIEITARNWLCAQVDLTWRGIKISDNITHQTEWMRVWMESSETRIAYFVELFLANNILRYTGNMESSLKRIEDNIENIKNLNLIKFFILQARLGNWMYYLDFKKRVVSKDFVFYNKKKEETENKIYITGEK